VRLADWEQRLHAFVAAAHDQPHAYGAHDCVGGLAAGVIEAVTGEDLGRAHRGKYRTEAGAIRYLKRLGFDSPQALLEHHLEEKPIGFAQRGDLVLVPGNQVPGSPEGWALPAVCYGYVALAIGSDGTRAGLFPVPRSDWLKAFGVGHEQ
jgi:hypothetical protein